MALMIVRLVSCLPFFFGSSRPRARRESLQGEWCEKGVSEPPRLRTPGLGKIEVIMLFGRGASNCVSFCFGKFRCSLRGAALGTSGYDEPISASAHCISFCTSWFSSVARAVCNAPFACSPPIRPSAQAACPRINASLSCSAPMSAGTAR